MWECVNALVGLIGKMSRGIEKGRRETAVVYRRLCRKESPCYGVGLADNPRRREKECVNVGMRECISV